MSKKKKQKKKIENSSNMSSGRYISTSEKGILDWLGIDSENIPRNALSQTTYYTCIKTLSEALGKMPLKLYQRTKDGIQRHTMTDTLRLLSLRPNEYMSSTIFWTLCEMCCQHYGNAFVWMDSAIQPKGMGYRYIVKGFYPMSPECVNVIIDNVDNGEGKGLFGTTGNLYYEYTNPDTGEQYLLRNDEVLHFKTWYTKDGILGLPVRDILKETIDGAGAASSYENSLYKNGMTARLVLQYTGNFDDDRIKEIQRKYGDKLTGAKAAGKVIAIPAGLTLTPLNMSMVDADFANLRKYSALQIAAAFGIKPSNLNDYEHSKYASSEAESIAFLSNFSYRLKMYEDEINAKVLTPSECKRGYYYKFNEQAILRTDSKTQSEILRNYVECGTYARNEARDFLDMPHKEGGDELLVNSAYIPVTYAVQNTNNGGKDK
jgi:HK97 family phage portal protein|nr:MAG TPA: portal protein [Caudoviricetes sp.]